MDNYRGICLLQIISRLVARIAAKRLTKHVEENQIIATEQWGFRPNRSAVDALFVMSRVMIDGARHADEDPIILDMMDIKKAYPNCSRNAMDKALELVGVPPRLRNIVMKLDSLTLYKCRSKVGLSESYTTLRGTREGCPAAPIKFNILHHVATRELRKRWSQEGLGGKVIVESFNEDVIWPSNAGMTRTKIDKIQSELRNSEDSLENVGYADDTTIITRVSESEARRKTTYDVFEGWGHAIHPDKWQRVWASNKELPKKRRLKGKQRPQITDIEENAKSLGCYLEADGGYRREQNYRCSRAGAIWLKLKKQIEKVQISNKTKGRLLRASVISALLYGVETRGPSAKHVKKMQILISGYERRLALGPSGGKKDMIGKYTQTDIRTMLGTISIQLEIDIRMIRYVGHIARLPKDRWEYKLLFGRVRPSNETCRNIGKDNWWEQIRKLVQEVMAHHQNPNMPWYEAAKDRVAWRITQKKWKDHRIEAERKDTQAARQNKWDLVAPCFESAFVLDKIWKKNAGPTGAGTSLEGQPVQWLKQVILAGGVSSKGWVERTPVEWKTYFEQESEKAWLKAEGIKVRRKVVGKAWAAFDGTLPTDDHKVPTKRIIRKMKVENGPQPIAPPPVPPAFHEEIMKRRRLKGKQPCTVRPANAETEESSDGFVTCNKCKLRVKQISLTQHDKLYCPLRESAAEPLTRQGRKILRPVPPKTESESKAAPSHTDIESKPKAPYNHIRWCEPLPPKARNATSLPSDTGTSIPKAAKRTSQAPAPQTPMGGCWGGCARCNQCGGCRRRICNGGCTGCIKCTKCRTWGRLLESQDKNACEAQSEAVKLEPVIKRKPKDPGNVAKAAFIAARPKDAKAGSTPCPYCKEWLPHYHQEGCSKMPYDIWITALKTRNVSKYGEQVVDRWSIQCQHCGSPFPSPASKRVHLSGCERRRNEAGLALNTYPVIRDTFV